MKKTLLLLPAILIGLYLSLSSYSSGPGSAISYDGSGGRGATSGCNCHGSTATSSLTLTITLDSAGIPVNHYVAGQNYTITITGTQTSSTLNLPKYGFQLTAINTSGAHTTSATNAGTLATTGLPTGCSNRTIAGSYHLIEHNSRLNPASGTGGAGTVYRQSIGWTAPATGGDTVLLLGVLNAVNNISGADAGDKWNTVNTFVTEENAPVTGPVTVCTGNSITLSCATSGGSWASSDAGTATVSASGVVTGISAGTVTISYTTSLGTSTKTITVNATPTGGVITGSATVCASATTLLSDSAGTAGGSWSSGATSIAIINSSTGMVTGISAGSAPITYTITNSCGSARAISSITVLPLAVAGTISGAASVCEGATTAFTDTVSGGTWSSSGSSIASVSSTGIVRGVSSGLTSISYTVSNSCGAVSTSRTINVLPLPVAGTITGSTISCLGGSPATLSVSGASGAGTWSTSDASTATVNTSGTVFGIALGSASIFYSVANGCGTRSTSQLITVNPLPFAGTITSSTTNLCIGSTLIYTDTISGGTWSSSNTNASVSAGIVTGVALGSAVISYSVTNSCGTAVATKPVNIFPLPDAGTITLPSYLCVGTSLPVNATGTGGALSLSNANASLSGSTITGITAGNVIISYSTTNSCGTATATKAITVDPLPFAGTITGPDKACPGSNVTLTNTAPGGTWTSSNPTISTVSPGGLVRAISLGFSGINYTVTNTCGSALVSFAFTVLGCTTNVDDLQQAENRLHIFPNPNTGSFSIKLTTPENKTAVVTISNVLGQKVSEFTIPTNHEYTQSLQYPSGIYLITCATDNEKTTTKMIIAE